MKKRCKLFVLFLTMVLSSQMPTQAGEVHTTKECEQGVLVTIDGIKYTPSQFMDRVIECTEKVSEAEEKINKKRKENQTIKCQRNQKGQKTRISVGEISRRLSYNEYGCVVHENTDLVGDIRYIYDDNNHLTALEYQKKMFFYLYDKDNHIVGLKNSEGEKICLYEYGQYGEIKSIKELVADDEKEHFDGIGDLFIGCVNGMRYDGKLYLSDVGLYVLSQDAYYDPIENIVYAPDMQLNWDKLYGENMEFVPSRISSSELRTLMDNAGRYYENGLREYTAGYTSPTWYEIFSGSADHYLCARIIYAENKSFFAEGDPGYYLNDYLKKNRQGEAWVIVNRLLEERYRQSIGMRGHFSGMKVNSQVIPSIYSILTFSGAFSTLSVNHAGASVDPTNQAYQEALWLACCIKVCNNFDQWNAMVPRPVGVTYQCYNKGNLPNTTIQSDWKLVVIPGWYTFYSTSYGFSNFPESSYLGKFNALYARYSDDSSIHIPFLYYGE